MKMHDITSKLNETQGTPNNAAKTAKFQAGHSLLVKICKDSPLAHLMVLVAHTEFQVLVLSKTYELERC